MTRRERYFALLVVQAVLAGAIGACIGAHFTLALLGEPVIPELTVHSLNLGVKK